MTIDELTEQIVAIKPSGFPGFSAGVSTGLLGASNTQSATTFQLQRTAIAFSEAYKSKDSAEELASRANELGGHIMTESAVGAINQKYADELIEAMYTLIDERK